MRQATLVAFYGGKPDALAGVIASCQQTLAAELSAGFRPYDLPQVHATLVGLERSPSSAQDNDNYRRLRGIDRAMDLAGFLTFVAGWNELPLRIQLGGFAPEAVPFRSRGEAPYLRSFSAARGAAVVMGWPSGGPSSPHPEALEELRRSAQRYGVLHAYHAGSADMDNDLYMRLGVIREGVSASSLERVSERVRCQLAADPVRFELAPADLRVVSYEDETLDARTSRVFEVSQLIQDRDLVTSLYG